MQRIEIDEDIQIDMSPANDQQDNGDKVIKNVKSPVTCEFQGVDQEHCACSAQRGVSDR